MPANTNKKQKTAFNDCPVLYKGTLRDHSVYSVVKLDKSHLSDIIGLHNKAIQMLTEAEKAFMLPKPASFFVDHFNRNHGNTVVGVVHKGKLIGEAIVLNPSIDHPKTGMVDMPPVGAADDITLLQGVTVLPTYRNNGLMHSMVKAWLNHGIQANKGHALAEVDVNNIASWATFLDQGMEIPSIGVDPSDGTVVYNLHETLPNIQKKRLTQAFNEVADGCKTCPMHDIETQKSMLDQGYVISGWKKATKEMILRPV
ncbi:GNAT family N-acetyltransferase [Micavibrio aeruginosavorus]|uniref:GNAT family N-acetyltransferase n=1 Tax=Micavibrio aeruginosavorus TaxID=349221 RepID=UPI003F4AAA46